MWESRYKNASRSSLEQRHIDRFRIVNIALGRLDTLMARAKDLVPQASLLAIVMTLPPSFAVVEVMILNDNLGIHPLQQPAQC